VLRRQKYFRRRKSHTAGVRSLLETLVECGEELLIRFLEDFRLVENQYSRFCIIEERGFHWLNHGDKVGNARKRLTVVCKYEFVIEVLFKCLIPPPLPRARSPVAKHFPADHNVLHGDNVDVLNRPARSLVVKIEFANRIDTV